MSEESDVPVGWTRATIEELVGTSGLFRDGDWVESEDQDPNGDVRLVQLADVGDGQYRDRSSRFLTSKKAAELRCTFLQEGDVLIARMPDPLGRACVFPGDDKAAVTVVDVCVVRGSGNCFDQRWLQWFVNAPKFRSAVAGLQSGSTRKRISRRNLATVRLPVPPLAEQRRIVAKIEELFSDLDAGVAALERVRAKLKRYRASVLNAAVTGKLTEEWRKQNPLAEPADKLLARILDARRKKWEEEQLRKFAEAGKTPPTGWQKRYSPPEPIGNSGLSPAPETWCWLTVDGLAYVTKLAGFEYTKYVKYDDAGELAVLKAENAGKEGFRRTDFSRVRLDAVEHLGRSRLRGGEVLMVFVGAGVGQVARVPTDQQYFLGPNIGMIRVESAELSPAYLEIFLRSSAGARLTLSFAKAVAQPSLSMGTIRKIPVALPPLIEQEHICSEVDRRLSVVEAVEAEVEHGLKRATRLRQAILKRAFEGKLVPQDPADEPASAILNASRRSPHPLRSDNQMKPTGSIS